MLALVLQFLLVGNTDDDMETPPIKVSSLNELHDQEVTASAEIRLEFGPSQKEFLACVPQESVLFPKKIPSDMESQIFTKEEMRDLMKCSSDDCKFNFSPAEIILFEQTKSADERQRLFFQLYRDRTTGARGADPHRSALFLRSRDRAFEDCDGNDFKTLLDTRPVKSWPFRLSVVKYNKKMRPTTRVVQGVSWASKNVLCYAEALIFSDHYDVDRVEVWSLTQGDQLKFQLRHRIDLLNSWFRRLNKEKFRKEAKEIAFRQMSSVVSCLKDHHKVNMGSKSGVTPTK